MNKNDILFGREQFTMEYNSVCLQNTFWYKAYEYLNIIS